MAKNKTTIKSEVDSILRDDASTNSILPSLVNELISDVIDNFASQEDGIKGRIETPSLNGGDVDLDLSLANHFKLTLTQNITLDYINSPSPSYGGTYVFEVTQDTNGNRTITFASGKFLSGGNTDIESGGDTISEIWMRWNGSKMVVNVVKNLIAI